MENLKDMIAKAGIELPEVTLAHKGDRFCNATCVGCTTQLSVI